MAITTIVTRQIADLAITTAKIAANAITLAKMGWASAKGDILVYDGSAYQKLAVGTDGQVLEAQSGQATGLQWVTGGAGLSSSNFVYGETPSGTVNGSNTNFTLANTPTSGTVRVYVNGVRMNVGAGNDYTISSTTITFLTGAIPQTGDVILTDYMK